MILNAKSLLIAFGLAFLLTGCGTTKNFPPLPQTAVDEYILDSGDTVRINVFGEERLSNTYIVSDKGDISVPLIGAVPTRGLTVNQLEDRIEQRLRLGIVVDPSVSAQVEEFRPFFVLGEVAQPGQYPYEEGLTVIRSIAKGGGFTFRADKRAFKVTRNVDGVDRDYLAGPNARLLPGDVVLVWERIL